MFSYDYLAEQKEKDRIKQYYAHLDEDFQSLVCIGQVQEYHFEIIRKAEENFKRLAEVDKSKELKRNPLLYMNVKSMGNVGSFT